MRQPMRGRDGATWAIPAALGVDAVGSGLYLPLSMVYFLSATDLSEARVGLLMTAASACALLLPLLVGRVVDRIGPRPVVIAGQLLQAGGFLLYLAVDGPASLFAAALVESAGLRVYWSSVFALIAEQGDDRSRDQWFARTAMIRAAGTGAGTVLAGVLLGLASQNAYRGMILANALSFLLAATALALFVRSRPRPAADGVAGKPADGVRHLLGNRAYLSLIGVNVLFNICTVLLAVATPVYVVRGLDAPGWAVGAFLTLTTAVVATSTAAVTRGIRRRTSRGGAMAWGGVAWAAWCGAIALAVLLPRGPVLVGYLALVMLLWAAAEMLHGPASNALSADAAPEGARGTYLAAFQYSFAAADMVTPGLFGLLYGVEQVLPWVVIGLLALAASAAIRPLERRLTAGRATAGAAGA
ncbi:MFS transporter [Streptomyces sp. MAR4 CNY-716]